MAPSIRSCHIVVQIDHINWQILLQKETILPCLDHPIAHLTYDDQIRDAPGPGVAALYPRSSSVFGSVHILLLSCCVTCQDREPKAIQRPGTTRQGLWSRFDKRVHAVHLFVALPKISCFFLYVYSRFIYLTYGERRHHRVNKNKGQKLSSTTAS